MRGLVKHLLYALPQPFRTMVLIIREWWWHRMMTIWESRNYSRLKQKRTHRQIRHVLIYNLNGMAFGGTEKCLQLIADALAEEYKVFFMYGDKTASNERRQAMHPLITFIPFSYEESEMAIPHRITGMQPHIKDILHKYEIDLIVTASPGYSHYPWNIINDIPIILINIFGAPTLQKNIKKVISISNTVRLHAEKWSGSLPDRDTTMYAPLAKLPPENVRELGLLMRKRLNIPQADFVFGRIGRNDDNIFDPIGIRAWQKIASSYPNAHYLIMSPSPTLVAIVESEAIPRVHFLPPSASETAVWSFHGAINAMAHFRRDGETSGVAIAESLMVGNPIITHRSHTWNAHLEYLDASCALIAAPDDVFGYSMHMETFIELQKKNPGRWSEMRESAERIGMGKFSPVVYSDNIRNIVANI